MVALSGDRCGNPFASCRPRCYQHQGVRGWLCCSRETSCKDFFFFIQIERWFLRTSRGTLRGLTLPSLGSSFISRHPAQNSILSLSQQSSHSPAIPCNVARSWRLCRRRTWLFICRAVSRSGLHSHRMPTGSKTTERYIGDALQLLKCTEAWAGRNQWVGRERRAAKEERS